MRIKFVQWFVPLAILAGGFVGARALIAVGPTATRGANVSTVPVVEVVTAEPRAVAVRVNATGIVEAATTVDLVPEVTGRVAWRSDKLTPGGRFTAGELIAKIESREYELAIAQERASVRSAELELELEKSRGKVAAQEWQLLRGKATKANPLALRTSQRETAETKLRGAKSSLKRTQLNLKRTRLRAPFNATVISEDLDIGQRVGPAAPVAQLIGTDEFWVRVGLRVEDLRDIDVPGLSRKAGSNVQISQRLADGTTLRRDGRVLRLVDALDATTRRAQLLISVPDPLAAVDGLPLLVGAYVEVDIEGRVVDGLVAIDPAAVQDGRAVWVVEDGRLQRREIRQRFAANGLVYVSGLEAQTDVVITPLSAPAIGMRVEARRAPNGSQERL